MKKLNWSSITGSPQKVDNITQYSSYNWNKTQTETHDIRFILDHVKSIYHLPDITDFKMICRAITSKID